MAITLSDIVDRVRHRLQDRREPLRHSDDKLYAFINDALAEAMRLRPDLFLPDFQDQEFNYTSADTGTAFPVDFAYYPAFVDYIAGMVSAEEDEFVSGGRAMFLLERFTQRLVRRGGA